MKKLITKGLLAVSVTIAICANIKGVYACEITSDKVKIVRADDFNIQSAEVIWRYRKYKGRKQKRLWSCTDNKWVSDHWIDV